MSGGRRARTILVEVEMRLSAADNESATGNTPQRWLLRSRGASGEVFNIHSVVDWVELQLWNRFGNGFDVFLGKASVSLHQLQQQCCEAAATAGTTQTSVTTGKLWFPLEISETNGLASHVSLQVECTFTSNPKVLRIREEIQQRRRRRARKSKNDGEEEDSNSGENVGEDAPASIADPAFAFTQPFHPVEWSIVASTSIRHLFFHVSEHRCVLLGIVLSYRLCMLVGC